MKGRIFRDSVTVAFRIEKADRRKLEKIARSKNERLSDLLREIIEAYLENEGETR